MTRMLTLIAGLGFAVSQLQAQNSPTQVATTPRDAVIVIRHAEDSINNVTKEEYKAANPNMTEGNKETGKYPFPSVDWNSVCQDWPNYYYDNFTSPDNPNPTTTGIVPTFHALSGQWQFGKKRGPEMKDGKESPLGEKQAIELAACLGNFLKKNNLSPIQKAYTMDPTQVGATPNPFDTLWPYLYAHNSIELVLFRKTDGTDRYPSMMNLITSGSIKPAKGGSAIVCWTGEGLSGRDGRLNEKGNPLKDKDGNVIVDGILSKLVKLYRGNDKFYENWTDVPVARCSDIFVFYKDSNGVGVTEKWKFEPTPFDPANGQSPRPDYFPFNLVEKHEN